MTDPLEAGVVSGALSYLGRINNTKISNFLVTMRSNRTNSHRIGLEYADQRVKKFAVNAFLGSGMTFPLSTMAASTCEGAWL